MQNNKETFFVKHMETNKIHFCIAADKNYKMPLRCSVYSIYKNSSKHPCVIHVLFDGLSTRYRNSLIRKYKNTNLSFDFKDMSGYEFDFHGINMQYWTKAMFYRIMIPEIFTDIKRILYIDGDTLVLRDMSAFFNMDFPSDTSLAMVIDRFSWKKCSVKLNVPKYFNSGVILFDLEKCKQDKFSQKCIEWLRNNQKIAQFPDQDAINAVYNDKILSVPNLYNKQYAPTEKISVGNQPWIIHFLSAIKPWMYKSPTQYSYEYIRHVPKYPRFILARLLHIIYLWQYFCFHKKHVMPMVKNKILEQEKYYIFNICVHTKTIDDSRPDLITLLQQIKETRNANKH